MLHWRIILGVLFISIIAALVWFDNSLSLAGTLSPGVVMMPLAFVGTFLCAGELVRLFEHDPHLPAPSRYVVVPGALATVVASAVPMLWHQLPGEGSIPAVVGRVGWVAIGLAIGSLGAFVIEMLRYKTPGSATMRLSLAIFGIAYAGGLMGFCVQLRMLAGGPWGTDGKWGMLAVMSMMVVVKTNDIGAYCFGRLFGKNKLAPILSPGKTWEGVMGGFLFSTIATMITLGPVAEAYGARRTEAIGRGFLVAWLTLGSLALWALQGIWQFLCLSVMPILKTPAAGCLASAECSIFSIPSSLQPPLLTYFGSSAALAPTRELAKRPVEDWFDRTNRSNRLSYYGLRRMPSSQSSDKALRLGIFKLTQLASQPAEAGN